MVHLETFAVLSVVTLLKPPHAKHADPFGKTPEMAFITLIGRGSLRSFGVRGW